MGKTQSTNSHTNLDQPESSIGFNCSQANLATGLLATAKRFAGSCGDLVKGHVSKALKQVVSQSDYLLSAGAGAGAVTSRGTSLTAVMEDFASKMPTLPTGDILPILEKVAHYALPAMVVAGSILNLFASLQNLREVLDESKEVQKLIKDPIFETQLKEIPKTLEMIHSAINRIELSFQTHTDLDGAILEERLQNLKNLVDLVQKTVENVCIRLSHHMVVSNTRRRASQSNLLYNLTGCFFLLVGCPARGVMMVATLIAVGVTAVSGIIDGIAWYKAGEGQQELKELHSVVEEFRNSLAIMGSTLSADKLKELHDGKLSKEELLQKLKDNLQNIESTNECIILKVKDKKDQFDSLTVVVKDDVQLSDR